MFRNILLILAAILFATHLLHAQNTHIVDATGNGDFETIHAAVAGASSGDTIRVLPDQYVFTDALGRVEINKRLIIIGSGYMPVDQGGTELVDLKHDGFFLFKSGSSDSELTGFRLSGSNGWFIEIELGAHNITIEENLVTIDRGINISGNGTNVSSNIFLETKQAVSAGGNNIKITNNIFAHASIFNQYIVNIGASTSGIVVANNLFLKNDQTFQSGSRLIYSRESPEIYSNAFISNSGTQVSRITDAGSAFITNNGIYDTSNIIPGMNPVEAAPNFVNFDPGFQDLDLEKIDAGDYDLRLAENSEYINAGRSGSSFLDTDGSRNDIGIYGGPTPFKDGKGAPTVPMVIEFMITPNIVSPSGTITIQAKGRIGSGN